MVYYLELNLRRSNRFIYKKGILTKVYHHHKSTENMRFSTIINF